MKKKKTVTNDKKIMQLEEMSWKQIEELDKSKTILYLPISPLEEHGPHLPVGTDFIIIKDAVNEAINFLMKKQPDLNYVLLPPIPLGYSKINLDFPGTISVSSKVIQDVVYGYGSALANHGFQNMMICTFHMSIFHLKGIYNAMKKLKSRYNMKLSEPWGPYFHSNMTEEREPKLDFDTSKEVHGGFRETSLMKYQYPYLVDESYKDLKTTYKDLNSVKILGKKFKEIGVTEGYVGSPARADIDYGRWYFKEIVNVIVSASLDLYHGKPAPKLPDNIRKIMKIPFIG